MKTARKAYSILLLLAAALLPQGTLHAQSEEEFFSNMKKYPKGGYMGYMVENGDTVYVDGMPTVWVFPKKSRKEAEELRKYYKLVYNFNKVYPYALAAKHLSQEVDAYIAENNLKGVKEDRYISQKQKELFKVFEKPLRSMTISQGRLLIRLCDRELGRSSYKVIKDYKNGFTAGFWQGVAKLFGHNLKSRYDPKGEDRITEELVRKWEKGEFDELYYSIFWEEPRKTDIPLKYR